MVLVTVSPKHNESTSKRQIEESEKEELRFNPSAFPTERNLQKFADEHRLR